MRRRMKERLLNYFCTTIVRLCLQKNSTRIMQTEHIRCRSGLKSANTRLKSNDLLECAKGLRRGATRCSGVPTIAAMVMPCGNDGLVDEPKVRPFSSRRGVDVDWYYHR